MWQRIWRRGGTPQQRHRTQWSLDWEKKEKHVIKLITAVSLLLHLFEAKSLDHNLKPTRRLLALEIANQLDDLIHVVETLQLTLVVNDLHGVFNDLKKQEANIWWIFKSYCSDNNLHQPFAWVLISWWHFHIDISTHPIGGPIFEKKTLPYRLNAIKCVCL